MTCATCKELKELNRFLFVFHRIAIIDDSSDIDMAEMSPLSEGSRGSNVECFQNFTAPEVFVQGLAGMVNQQDVEAMIRSQKYM